jgi:phosphoglycolate phosphatase-like HAD superfamily hydrolase
MNTIYIDFDGTLVDVNYRYYIIFNEFINYHFSLNTDFTSYIKFKRSGFKDHHIIEKLFGKIDFNIENYLKFKRLRLEDLAWLKTDKLIGNPTNFVKNCNDYNLNVILLTQRNNFENLKHQLSLLKIRHIFKEIYVVPPKAGINVKFEFLKEYADTFDIIIGDSKAELEAGNRLKIPSFFVNTGLNNSTIISEDTIFLNDYSEVLKYFK